MHSALKKAKVFNSLCVFEFVEDIFTFNASFKEQLPPEAFESVECLLINEDVSNAEVIVPVGSLEAPSSDTDVDESDEISMLDRSNAFCMSDVIPVIAET